MTHIDHKNLTFDYLCQADYSVRSLRLMEKNLLSKYQKPLCYYFSDAYSVLWYFGLMTFQYFIDDNMKLKFHVPYSTLLDFIEGGLISV